MTDREKIKLEVERLKNELIEAPNKSEIDLGRISAFEDILLYINSLPEEHVNKNLEDFAKEYSFNIPSDVFYDMPEEKQTLWKREIENAIVVGANWQKEQFEKNRLAACERQTREEAEREQDFVMSIIDNEHRQPTFSDAIEYGVRWQKQQMMKDGIDAIVYKIVRSYLKEMDKDAISKALANYKDGDKVKLIIVKED